MSEIYKVNGVPNLEKINEYDEQSNIYYRFQCKNWEMGTKSWGMVFTSEEDALENCEEWGMSPEDAILNGKSACSTANHLWDFAQYFDKDFRVLVLNGDYVEEGHDGEDVISVNDILEIWDYNDFINCMQEMYE